MREELRRDEAVAVVAHSARRLFPIVSEQQARELATLMLRDLEARGHVLMVWAAWRGPHPFEAR